MRLCLITRRLPPARCGIGDYTMRLAAALTAEHEVSVVSGRQSDVDVGAKIAVFPAITNWGPSGLMALAHKMTELRPDWVCLEYVPYLYGRRGVNGWLPIAMLWMRLRGVRVILMVHEPFVELDTPKHILVGIIQRAMLALLIVASERVAVTTSKWTRMLSRFPLAGSRRVFCLPVGSNLVRVDLSSTERRCLRSALGFSDSDVVIAILQPSGAGKLFDVAMSVWRALKQTRPSVKLLIIGESPSVETQAERGDVQYVGYVPADHASRLLQSADLFFLPFVDGVSARRTSVMAAMAHGLPIVTTAGHLTDPVFTDSPVVMRQVNDIPGLIEALDAFVDSPSLRARQGEATRAFYSQHFDWRVLADRLSSELSQ